MDKGEPPLPLLPSQMDFCIISDYSVLIYHAIHIYASIFITYFVELKPFRLSYFFYNFLSCENSKEYCHSDIIKAFLANALFYSNPMGFWRTVPRENLNPKLFMGGQPFQRRGRCRTDLTFTVIHLREKLSHLSSHSGNLISETGLFLNCARDK